jgi:hypothetical protein
VYDETFYEYEDQQALTAAIWTLPPLLHAHNIRTVIDIGAGTGAWAFVAHQYGCETLAVDQQIPEHLLYPTRRHITDLTEGYDCSGYQLAICLEVAEHLPAETAEPLIAGLTKADIILFSAATPGQPGVGHINCQPHQYWHQLFAQHHKTPTKPILSERIADYYQRNIYLYQP